MATAASPRLLVSLAATDRKFYTGIASVMLFTALVGFSRTYFLGLISGPARTIIGRRSKTQRYTCRRFSSSLFT